MPVRRLPLIIALVSVAILSTFFVYLPSEPRIFAVSANMDPPGFAQIDGRGLDVIVAFMDRNGSLVVREAGGLRGDGIVPEQTLVDIGSITKTVTAVAVLKLVEQDRLALDDTLDSIWRDVPDDKASITIHELLTHTSGFPEDVGRDKERLSRDGFLDRVFEADIDEDRFGEYHYSNVGYGVLAAAVEQLSGKSFENFVRQQLLEPSGLDPIGYASAYQDVRSLLTSRRWQTGFARRTVREASWGARTPGWNLIGNGGMVSTPGAYLRFWAAVREGRVIDRSLLRMAFARHVDARDQDGAFYGYGLMLRNTRAHGTVYGHDGQNDVFSAEWRDLGDSGLTIFTAGRGKDAFRAMKLILRELDRRRSS